MGKQVEVTITGTGKHHMEAIISKEVINEPRNDENTNAKLNSQNVEVNIEFM